MDDRLIGETVMRLKNWSLTSYHDSNFTAPELRHYHLQGNVYGNPKFEDGDSVVTSRIVMINDKGDYKEVTTHSGSVYELHREDVDCMAEEQFPNYYDRLGMYEFDNIED